MPNAKSQSKSKTKSKSTSKAKSKAGSSIARTAAAAAPPAPGKAKVGRPSHGPHMKRKNFFVDQRKLDEAKDALGVATETEAIDAALSKLTKKHRVLQALTMLATIDGLDYAFEDDRPSENDLK